MFYYINPTVVRWSFWRSKRRGRVGVIMSTSVDWSAFGTCQQQHGKEIIQRESKEAAPKKLKGEEKDVAIAAPLEVSSSRYYDDDTKTLEEEEACYGTERQNDAPKEMEDDDIGILDDRKEKMRQCENRPPTMSSAAAACPISVPTDTLVVFRALHRALFIR